jgi:hypothetical protein
LLVEVVEVDTIHLPVMVVLVAEQPVKMVLVEELVAVVHSQEAPDTQQAQHYKADLQTHPMVAVAVVAVEVTGAEEPGATVLLQTPAVVVVRVQLSKQVLKVVLVV